MTTTENTQVPSVEKISEGKCCYAIIVRSEFREKGIHFFTQDAEPMQVGSMIHPAGKIILPHIHQPQERTINGTHEVLVIRKGQLKVDFYRPDQSLFCSRILREHDLILLMNGGHGFQALTDLEMIEVKQGPYSKEKDKVVMRGEDK